MPKTIERTADLYKIDTLEDFDRYCIENASHFRCVRGLNPQTRTRENFATLDEARAYAAQFSDGRTLIYAVTGNGRAAAVENI